MKPITAEEFRKMWLQQNPDIIHIPSEHEIGLMEAYAKYCRSQPDSVPSDNSDESELMAYAGTINRLIDDIGRDNSNQTRGAAKIELLRVINRLLRVINRLLNSRWFS